MPSTVQGDLNTKPSKPVGQLSDERVNKKSYFCTWLVTISVGKTQSTEKPALAKFTKNYFFKKATANSASKRYRICE